MNSGTLKGAWAWTFLAGACLGWPAPNAANRDPIIDAVPAEAALVMVVESMPGARREILQTDLGRLLQDPAVKRFREHGLRKINAKLGELRTAYGLEWADVWTLFPGTVAAGCVFSPTDGPSPAEKDVRTSLFVISDLGESVEPAGKLLGRFSEFLSGQFEIEVAKRAESFWQVSNARGGLGAFGISGRRAPTRRRPECIFPRRRTASRACLGRLPWTARCSPGFRPMRTT